MMNELEELQEQVRSLLGAAFPKFAITFEAIEDDPFHVGVNVFGVERDLVKWVEERVLDLGTKLCENTEFLLTPLVRDLDTTQRFYPQFLSPWQRSECLPLDDLYLDEVFLPADFTLK